MSHNAPNLVQLRQKRLRHISWIKLKNLQIKTNFFFVWFTLHFDERSSAIYISDKIENDRHPNWKLKNHNKFPQKKFILRVWYSDKSNTDRSNSILNLLLQADIDLDHFVYLGDVNLNFSSSEFSNFIILEFFDNFAFCEPIDYKLPVKNQNYQNLNTNEQKKSYDLSLLRRLCNFDRVIRENRKKADNFKSHTNPRIESLYQYTKLKMQMEEKSWNIELYKMRLDSTKQSIMDLRETNRTLNQSILLYKKNMDNMQIKCRNEHERIKSYRKNSEIIIREQIRLEKAIKTRQQELVSDLSEIFFINTAKDGSGRIINVCFDLSKKYDDTKDNELNVALGFFVQALDMLSFIKAVPLRYPMVLKSSKSAIVEFVENGNIKEYALYRTTNGFDSNFIYALKLLECNLIQLRYSLDPTFDFRKADDLISHLKWIFDNLVI